MAAKRSIHSSRPWMPLGELSELWSRELGCELSDLVNELNRAVVNGQLDFIKVPGGLIRGIGFVSPIDGAVFPTESAKLREMHIDRQGFMGNVVFMREAVQHFARERELAPPSFWPQPRGRSAAIGGKKRLPESKKPALQSEANLLSGTKEEKIAALIKNHPEYRRDDLRFIVTQRRGRPQKRREEN